MGPAVMADFVAGLDDLLAHFRIGFDHHAWNEEGALDVVLVQQREDARHADGTELAARNRRRRGQAPRDEAATWRRNRTSGMRYGGARAHSLDVFREYALSRNGEEAPGEQARNDIRPVLQQPIIRKPAVASKGGIVAAQSRKAAEVGAEVLAAGGDCIDAVVATGFALGVLEPWMNGLGGGGAMVLYRAREDRYEVIDYGMRAPDSLRVEDYPLTGEGAASDIFPWARVKDDRNLHGPGSIAVPGVVAGMEEAHRRHARCRGRNCWRRPSSSRAKACWWIGGPPR